MLRYRKNMNAIIIQKYMKGYKESKRVEKQRLNYKIHKHDEFFREMRDRIEMEAVEMIQRCWIKYQQSKVRQEEIEQERKRQEWLATE